MEIGITYINEQVCWKIQSFDWIQDELNYYVTTLKTRVVGRF